MATSKFGRTPTRRLSRFTRATGVALAIAAGGAAAAALVLSTACEQGGVQASALGATRAAPVTATAAPAAHGAPQQLRVHVLASFPHDSKSYTQGLLWEPAGFIESAGGYGDSLVRRWRPGVARPLAQERLSDGIFAEGIAVAGATLIQLTWREGIAFYRDLATLREQGRRSYEGEGWGLCFDGTRLFMSDGSYLLTERDPESFLELRRVAVMAGTAAGAATPIDNLNELECAQGSVYANIYGTDRIARIDPSSGWVTAMIDASGLLTPAEREAGAEVLNGIAYNTATETFYLTGKLWPRLFEVKFEPAAEQPAKSH